MRATHTFVLLAVSDAAYNEIKKKLEDAGYGHVFAKTDKGVVMDMHGIAISREGEDD